MIFIKWLVRKKNSDHSEYSTGVEYSTEKSLPILGHFKVKITILPRIQINRSTGSRAMKMIIK